MLEIPAIGRQIGAGKLSYLKRLKLAKASFQERIGRQIDRNFAALLVVAFFLSGLNYWIIVQVAEQLEQNLTQTPIATKLPPLATRVITKTRNYYSAVAPSATTAPTKTLQPTPRTTVTPIPTLPWGLAIDTYFAALPYPAMRMPAEWDISPDGLKYVEFWEGYYGAPYDDGGPGVGNCTIGYGHLLHLGPCNGSESMTSISQQQAEQLLLKELRNCGTYVAKYVTVRVSQNQYNILSGLVCGVGYDRFRTYKFTALLNKGVYYEAAEQLRVTGTWGIGIGYCPGLVRRRKYEADHFTTMVPLWPIPPGY